MKKTALTLPAVLLLAACVSANQAPQSETEAPIGMANPASEHCVQHGGKSEIRKNADGSEYGVCHLPDGRVVEEWQFFRANHH